MGKGWDWKLKRETEQGEVLRACEKRIEEVCREN